MTMNILQNVDTHGLNTMITPIMFTMVTYTINTGNTGMNVKFLSVTKTLMNVIQLILTVTILKTVSMNKCHTVITPITLLTVACTTNMVTTSMTTDRLTSLKTNLQLG